VVWPVNLIQSVTLFGFTSHLYPLRIRCVHTEQNSQHPHPVDPSTHQPTRQHSGRLGRQARQYSHPVYCTDQHGYGKVSDPEDGTSTNSHFWQGIFTVSGVSTLRRQRQADILLHCPSVMQARNSTNFINSSNSRFKWSFLESTGAVTCPPPDLE